MFNLFKKKTSETFEEKRLALELMAAGDKRMAEACILATLGGAIEAGSVRELAGICVQFARAELIRIEAIKESMK